MEDVLDTMMMKNGFLREEEKEKMTHRTGGKGRTIYISLQRLRAPQITPRRFPSTRLTSGMVMQNVGAILGRERT